MKNAKICSDLPVTLIGGGALGHDDLELARAQAPKLVAADGGADQALAAGYVPDAVIGDLDSLTKKSRALIGEDCIFEISEQDSTDFDKALRSINAPLVLAVGFLGNRMDHQLAALGGLVRHADRACVLIGSEDVIFHLPAVFHLDLPDGEVVSIFPMRPVTGRSTGLAWPINGLCLSAEGRVGTSNRATGPVRVETDGSGALMIVRRAMLRAVMQGFAAIPRGPGGLLPGRPPARAG